MIHDARVRWLNRRDAAPGRFVLYWMQQAQRALDNHALEFAIDRANRCQMPLVVLFVLTDAFPGANLRHYAFMVEGLEETRLRLAARGIAMVTRVGAPPSVLARFARDAALVVVDRAYTRVPRRWRDEVAAALPVPLAEVDTDVVVPVAEASAKEEYAARTIRPKIVRRLGEFLDAVQPVALRVPSVGMDFGANAPIHDLFARLKIDRTVAPSPDFRGGTGEALRRLETFLRERLATYDEGRNDPRRAATSELSAYLHFGQISPVTIARRVRESGLPGADAYLEQLIVRRELAVNFVVHNPNYDSIACLPDWARATLAAHRADRRAYLYAPDQWEAAQTHDPYWNAAQRQMVVTGCMPGHLRMYWGKKILEWSRDPETAYGTAIALNDKYELDGRDPNGYAGVAWCFGKHDQAWGERPIFGKVRYMNAAGLRRKFDADAYVRETMERYGSG